MFLPHRLRRKHLPHCTAAVCRSFGLLIINSYQYPSSDSCPFPYSGLPRTLGGFPLMSGRGILLRIIISGNHPLSGPHFQRLPRQLPLKRFNCFPACGKARVKQTFNKNLSLHSPIRSAVIRRSPSEACRIPSAATADRRLSPRFVPPQRIRPQYSVSRSIRSGCLP